MRPALTLTKAVVRIDRRVVLDGVGVTVRPGEVVGVLGANGAGKTTLLRAALGLARLERGSAMLDERDVGSLTPAERASLAGYLPQDRRVAWSLPAWRIAALGAVDRADREAKTIALDALDRVGLSALADRGVLEMSGGERARVLIARLLATRAPLLVADEPVAGLDPDAQLLVVDLLREAASDGAGVLLTLHDLTLAVRACDRLIVLAKGRVASEGPPRQALAPEMLARAFGVTAEWLDTAAGPTLSLQRTPTKR